MSHRRTAAAVALSALVLTVAGCADDSDTARDTAADATTAPTSDASPSDAVVAHAEAYAAVRTHPAYVHVQTAEPETLPAFVDEVTHGKLAATSNGKVWTFTDVSGDCATVLSTDETGGEIYETTCAGVAVDDEFEKALNEVLADLDEEHAGPDHAS